MTLASYSRALTVMKPVMLALSLLVLPSTAIADQVALPIIDMHMHAKGADDFGPPPVTLCLPVTLHGVVDPQCSQPFLSPPSDEAMIELTVGILERRNIIGVLSGRTLEKIRPYQEAAPGRLIPAYQLKLGREEDTLSPAALRRHLEAGDFRILGEITNQYAGIVPDDERREPYWALAEELDIPVAIHLGEGYPGAPYLDDPDYRVRFGSPLLLEEVLVRHPKLRLYVMHYGSPLVDEMIAVMQTYPNVYIDIGGNTWPYPREYFYSQLKQFIDAGFGKRILFGSDQMMWPELIELSIEIIEQAPFLSEEQRRDILYNNAARFLRLSEEEMTRHHGR